MKIDPLLQEAASRVRSRFGRLRPRVAVILGSGLNHLAGALRDPVEFPYADLPLFPHKQLAGHRAGILLGTLDGVDLLLFCGRFHVYQGLDAYTATAPVRLAAELGCDSLLLTCAVGGINPEFRPGDFLLVRDHLNFSSHNPLRGLDPPAFIDLHDCYRHEFLGALGALAADYERKLGAGTLAYMPGPSYETPAEIRALECMGADAVGMSTVLEAIMARALGLQVACLALVTNMAGGSAANHLAHEDVLACAASAAAPFSQLVRALIPFLAVDKTPDTN